MSKVNIKDVAKKANVSIATVSNVINGTGRVSASTIRKVQKIVDEMQYSPSIAARNLKDKNSHLIAVVVPFLVKGSLQDNPFYWQLVRGIEEGARNHRFQVILMGVTEDETFSFVHERHLDGLIVIGIYEGSPTLQQIKSLNIPCVFVDSYLSDPMLHQIYLDDEQGGYIGTKHLIGLGHRRIGILSGVRKEGGVDYLRYQGYLRALSEAGIDEDPSLIFTAPSSMEGGYQMAQRVGDKQHGVTALFVFSDIMTMGVIKGLYDLGLTVPTDISVVGFDDLFFSKFMIPSLTTVRQDIVRKGKITVEMLLDQINGQDTAARKNILPIEFCVRQSTAPYRP